MNKENTMKLGKRANFLRGRKKIKVKKENFFRYSYGGLSITELFTSLRDELKGAVAIKYGKNIWIDDFSDAEVVFSKDMEIGRTEYDEEGNRIYYRCSYMVKDGEVAITSDAVVVKRITSYIESIVSFKTLMNMAVYQMEIRKNE